MRKKGRICAVLAAIMLIGGCSGTNDLPAGKTQTGHSGQTADKETADNGDNMADSVTEADLSGIIPEETVTLDVYSQLSGYQGEQQGWFAKILLDKFNVKLNFTYDGTDNFYERQAESKDLGDIVIWGTDSDQYHQAVKDGLLLDWEEDGLLSTYGVYIKEHMAKALQKNRDNSYGHIYGFGYDVAAESGEFGDFDYHPDIRWDLYEQIGKPEVNELEDYVDILKQMKEICPVSDSGKETYGVSLFSDWDGDMMMFAKSTCTNFFGMDEFGVGLYDADTGRFEGCLQDGGSYIRTLRFYNDLYRNGLLDPESRTQGYAGCIEDYQDGAAFFCIFSWLAAPQYNSVNHTADGKIMLPLAAKNQDTLVYGLNENGGNRLWTAGSGTEHKELVMALLNWLCTPEGRLTTEYGPKGVGWDYDLEKNTCLLEPGYQALTGETIDMPENSGFTGVWQDGIPQFNNTTWTLNTINPESDGQTYSYTSWPNVIQMETSSIEKRWREENKVDNTREYLTGFKYSVSRPNTYTASTKPQKLGEKWGKVTEIIRNGSWDCIFSETVEEFDNGLQKMLKQADNAGYKDCVKWCKREAARRKALEE